MSKRIIYICAFLLIIPIGIFLYIKFDKSNREFSVTFLNVGQGDAALIKFENGEKMLVDCGIDRKILQRLGENMPFYDRVIDYLLVTHPDSDHYGGCSGVLKRYDIKHIITNGEEKNGDQYWSAWKKYAEEENATNQIINKYQELQIGGSILNFIAPSDDMQSDEKLRAGNNNSIVFTLYNNDKKFIFMGDAEAPLEDALMQKYCVTTTPIVCPTLKSDYIKIGHHGSDSSSGELFLDVVGAKEAIISVGKNTFGHPSFRILKKLQRAGAEVLRTDKLGDITLP